MESAFARAFTYEFGLGAISDSPDGESTAPSDAGRLFLRGDPGPEGWAARIHPEDAARVTARRAEQALAREREAVISYRLHRFDGTWVHVDDFSTLIMDDDGTPRGFAGTVIDVSHRIAAQAATVGELERYRLASEAANALVYDVVLDQDDVTFVHGLQEVLGYGPLPLTPWCEWWRSLVHPEDLPAHLERLHHLLEFRPGERAVYRVRAADGGWRYVEDVRRLLKGADGEPDRLVAVIADVTPREEGRRLIAAHDATLQEALDAGGLATWEYDLVADELNCDRRVLQMFDLPADRKPTVAELLASIVPADRPTREQLAPLWDPAIGRAETTFRVVRRNGELRWIHSMERAEFGPEGTPLRVIGIDRDVTVEQRALADLRASEERFRTIANLGPAYVWSADPNGTLQFAGDSWLEYTGLSLEDNRRWDAFVVHPDDRVRCIEAWDEATASGKLAVEVRTRRHDGEYRWMDIRAVPLRDAAGTVTSWVGITLDVHERRLAEEQLRENAEWLRLAQEVALTGVVQIDVPSGRVRFDARAARILDIAPEVRLDEWGARIHPDDMPMILRVMRAGRDPGASDAPRDYTMEYRVQRRDGSWAWVYGRGRTLFDGSGVLAARRTLVTVQDITNRKAAEESQRNAEERLRQALTVGQLGTFEYDPERHVVTWDETAREIFGIPTATTTLQQYLDRVHIEDRERVGEEVRRSWTLRIPWMRSNPSTASCGRRARCAGCTVASAPSSRGKASIGSPCVR
ncbi:MAG: PAS domain-containing protein [Dehalococcoidia bacterium]